MDLNPSPDHQRVSHPTEQIVVSAQSHWEDWDFPAGTLEISPRGAVRPRRWNRNTDATEDIVDFLRFQLERHNAIPRCQNSPAPAGQGGR